MSRILVVEDSPDIRVLIRMLLEAAGHEVLTAPDGRAAIETARSEQPDLVLMDLSLPTLRREAHGRSGGPGGRPRFPSFAVTAHGWHGDAGDCRRGGCCDGVIAKRSTRRRSSR